MNKEVYQVDLPDPPIGNKIFLAERHGIYVLEKKACAFRALANTRQGNGSIFVYDGIPDENGHFAPGTIKHDIIKNGRKVFNASPPILGMWMFDGGLHYGCTLVLEGSYANPGLAPCVTITWAPDKQVKRRIENV